MSIFNSTQRRRTNVKYHSNPSRADGTVNVETYYKDEDIDMNGHYRPSGWYYRYLDHSNNPTGPFASEQEAIADFTNDLPWSEFYK